MATEAVEERRGVVVGETHHVGDTFALEVLDQVASRQGR
jgi:hypothetical protein